MKKIDNKNKELIHSKISGLAKFPNISNVKRLTNFEPAYRLRIGDYRVLFDVSEDTIEIGRVLHRKNSYK
jgi:mRNA interferase RelE/StbE